MRSRAGETELVDVLIQGRRMHVLRAGSGPPLILIHGLVGSHRNWRRNIDALAASSTVYAIDLLNMGASDRVKGLDASLEATASHIVSLMDVLGLEHADIAGHSHGGAIALSLAARYPERVSRLILFAPANPFCALGNPLIRFYRTIGGRAFARLIPRLPRWTKATALARMYGDASRVPMDALEGYTQGIAVPGTVDHVLQILQRWHADMAALQGALPNVAATPTLLLWGDRDRAVGLESAHELQQHLRRSRLIILPGAGHIAFEEMPEPCNRAVLDFLAETSAAERDFAAPVAHNALPARRPPTPDHSGSPVLPTSSYA